MNRELDAQVAEEVMELHDVRGGRYRVVIHGRVGCGYWKTYDIPHYSSRIQDAWLVVEKMIDPTEDEFNLEFCDGWIATFRICGVGIFERMEPFSAAHAICLAALEAVRGEQGC